MENKMAAKIDLGDYMKCRICLSPFTKPRMLDCLHIFCTPCLETLAGENAKLTCPLCRSMALLPVAGVAGLPIYQTNTQCTRHVLDQVQDDTGSLSLCQLCEVENVAFVKCIDCDKYLCKECHKYHSRLKISKDHQIEFLQEDDESFKSECNEHKKELTLFCKPCNKSLCIECQKTSHEAHEVKALDYVALMERDILYAGIGGLKSKVLPIIENTLEQAKTAENNFNKHCSQIKQEIKAQATGLKEVFCRTIDLAMNSNLSEVERLKKNEIKQYQTYIDRLETDRIAHGTLLQTSEEIIGRFTDAQIVKESPNIRQRMDNMKNYTEQSLKMHLLKYESGEILEEGIRKLVGVVTLVESNTIKTSFRQLPIPNLQLIKSITKSFSFNTQKEVRGMVGGQDANVWVLYSQSVCSYSREGKVQIPEIQTIFDDESQNASKLLRQLDGSIYIWRKDSAKEVKVVSGEDTGVELYKVPFDNGSVGCFVGNNNLVVYNPKEQTFYEINAQGDIKTKVNNEALSSVITNQPIKMVEAVSGSWIIAQSGKVITLRPDGRLQNISESSNREIQSLCRDNYGHVFIGMKSVSVSYICLLSPDGTLTRDIHQSASSVQKPLDMTIDGCGNMWICHGTNVEIYEYM
jgi:hypothetical protein